MLSFSLAGNMVLRSERSQGEIPQHQLLVSAALAHALERRIDEQLELRVFAVDGDGHPVAEILGLAERPALELAARLGGGAVEPEGERDPVVEQEGGGAADERGARQLRRGGGADRAVAGDGTPGGPR